MNEFSERPVVKVTMELPNSACEYFCAALLYQHPAPGGFIETANAQSRSPVMAVSHALHELGDKLEARYRAARQLVDQAGRCTCSYEESAEMTSHAPLCGSRTT